LIINSNAVISNIVDVRQIKSFLSHLKIANVSNLQLEHRLTRYKTFHICIWKRQTLSAFNGTGWVVSKNAKLDNHLGGSNLKLWTRIWDSFSLNKKPSCR